MVAGQAGTIRCTNGATISISGAGTIPKHSAGENSIRIFGDEGVLVYANGHGAPTCSDAHLTTMHHHA